MFFAHFVSAKLLKRNIGRATKKKLLERLTVCCPQTYCTTLAYTVVKLTAMILSTQVTVLYYSAVNCTPLAYPALH